MKVLLFLAKGFETMEASVFIDVFGWARTDFGLEIGETVGFQREVATSFWQRVLVDKTIDEIKISDYDALAIPGGFEEFAFYEEAFAPRFLELIRAFEASGKPIASICVASLALGKSGILKNRRATTYHLGGGRRQQQLADFGVQVVNEPVVLDDNVITSWCPETAPAVAFKLLEILSSKKETDEVRIAMGYNI